MALADAVVKSSIILVAAWLASLALRRGSAAARHLIWTAAACALLLLPALSLVAPSWNVPVSTVMVPAAGGPVFRAEAISIADLGRVALGEPVTAPAPVRAPGRTPGLGTIWAAGALLSLAPLLAGWIAVWRRRREAAPYCDALASELCAGLRVRIYMGASAAMPVSGGVFRPFVILPAEFNSWPEPRRRMVLLHELGHVRRRDGLTQTLARLACSLYWFHPLAWFAARQAVKERERACDDAVLRAGTRASEYASELLEVARSMAAPRLQWGAAAMARPAQLEGRLLAILDSGARRGGLSRAGVMAAALVTAIAVAPIAALRPVQAQVPAPNEVDKLVKQGVASAAQGNIEAASQAYRSAAEAQKRAYGPTSIEYADALLREGRFLRQSGDFRQASALFSTLLPLCERVYGPSNPEISDVYEVMGNVALKGGDFGKAAQYYNHALALSPKAAARLTALLGATDMFAGDNAKAEAELTQALSLGGENISDHALALELYAQLMRRQQRAAEAENAEAEAFMIRRRTVEASFKPPTPLLEGLVSKVGPNSGVTPPQVVSKVEPQYSEMAWVSKFQGMAVYSVVIGADGSIMSATVKKSAGFGLDESGAAALHNWKFEPAMKEGRPVPVMATIEVNFRLL